MRYVLAAGKGLPETNAFLNLVSDADSTSPGFNFINLFFYSAPVAVGQK